MGRLVDPVALSCEVVRWLLPLGSGTACCGWSNELTAGLQRPPCSSNALVSVTCWRKALGGCVALSVFKVSVILDGGDDKHNPSVQKRCRGK